MSWTRENAIRELQVLINEISNLESKQAYSTDHTEWLLKVLTFLEDVFGQAKYHSMFRTLTWRKQGIVFFGGTNPSVLIAKQHHQAYLEQLETAKGILLAALDHIKRASDLSSLYEGKDTPPESSAIIKVIHLAEHKLRKTIRDTPSNEKVIQDAFENLLIANDIEYSRETKGIEYSSKTYTVDFVVKKIDLAIEVKLCNKSDREKQIIAEINDDILAYQTVYGNIFFIIYDIGFIRDIDLFKDSFERNNNVIVKIIKH